MCGLVSRAGMSLQKKSVRELRLMFDNTAYFDTDQITSILMVTVTAVAIPPRP